MTQLARYAPEPGLFSIHALRFAGRLLLEIAFVMSPFWLVLALAINAGWLPS